MEEEITFKWSYVFIPLTLLIIVIFWLRSVFVTSPWEITLLKTLGSITPQVYTEWLHFKNPFFGKVITINTRGVKVEETANASTNDLQKVSVNVAVTYQIDGNDWVMTLYRKIGDDNMVADVVAKPNIREWVRAIFAWYKADELITKRKEVSEKITQYLTDQFKTFGLTVADVNVSDVNFSASFDSAVEAKVKAEQDALAQKNQLEKVKYEAQQQIERAKAEAETIRIQSAAIKENGGAEYVQLQWIAKWNWVLPQYSLSSDSQFILPTPSK